ncbi:hypothetical protein BGZ96_001651 [Linnemannia gamsii]|uniref:F-box domain-containing protein n=1 Tax=Linnemannia gamsii TaxID=64522 RepID=A0ABQ7JLV8_9FUNG|nr:hypothetical protein BGZ96_001651 [Linnemannia gamsii]
MTATTHATVFDIHLLQMQICTHLTLRDIRRCSLVSKDFYINFSPHLYRTIHIHRKATFNKFHRPESLAALSKHRNQVTHVTCEFARIWKTLLDHQCYNLVTLTSGRFLKRYSNVENNKHQTRYISDLIEVNPRLHSVDLGQFLFEPEVVTRFCSVLRTHTKIQELSIVVCPTFSGSFYLVWQLLWSSFRLEKLCIDVYNSNHYFKEMSDLQFQEYPDLTGSKKTVFPLKDLSLPVKFYSHEHGAFFRFLEYTPHIERFVTPKFTYDHQIEGLRSVMQTTVTNIQHLNAHSIGIDGHLVAEMIRLCRNLKSFVSSPRQNRMVLVASALLEHRETLEEVHMIGAGRMESMQVLYFLTECPKLQIFDVMCKVEKISPDPEVLTRQRMGDVILSTADMNTAAATSTIPWACTGLKVLKLRYAVPERAQNETEEDKGVTNDWVLPKVLYDQIAVLTELETLWLGRVEPALITTEGFFLALRAGRGEVVPELEPHKPESETEIRQYEMGTLYMSKALMSWRSLSKLRQLHLRGLKNFIEKSTVKEARKCWKDLDWIWYN